MRPNNLENARHTKLVDKTVKKQHELLRTVVEEAVRNYAKWKIKKNNKNLETAITEYQQESNLIDEFMKQEYPPQK